MKWFRPSRIAGAVLLAIVLVMHLARGSDADASWRDGWWDLLHQTFPRDRGDPDKAPAVVIAIDEDTMQETQRWPWPRDLLAQLINDLAKHGASVVAFDIFLDDTDPQSPHAVAQRFRDQGEIGAAELLEGLDDTDLTLARSINNQSRLANVRTILPVPGVKSFPGVNPLLECRFQKPIILLEPPEIRANFGEGFVSADPPLLLYREAGVELAAIDFDAGDDFVVRKVNAVQPICDSPFLLLGPEALRLATDGFYAKVQETWSGLEIFLDDPSNPDAVRFPVERDGSFWLHYGELGVEAAHGRGRELRRYISAREVLSPGFDSSRIAGKIALVAVIDLGRIDERRAPLGPIIYGVEAHMQMIEQITTGQFLRRPWFMFWIEAALLLIGGILIIAAVPQMRAQRSVLISTVVISGLIAASTAAFLLGLLVDVASPVLGLLVTSVGVIAATLIERDRQRLQTQVALQSERADRAFLQGELDAAARIQSALLPADRFTVAGRVDLACHIEPARTVGGDFYDHVLVDNRHLFFLVADVSGKGADASQFMLLSKTLWKSVALRNGAPLERIQIDANAEITRENVATMFVTGLCGLLDLQTGELSYSSAGHDAPFLFGDGKPPAQLESFAGPPAGLMDEIDFPVGRAKLQPGDRLCLFTDGVTEAMDSDGNMFGIDRLEATLATAPAGLASDQIIAHLTAAVANFTGDAEQSDDVTMMVITIPNDPSA
ncbi:MAG: SpoIIE family protein phosphatase [Pseudomonadota bacterium]